MSNYYRKIFPRVWTDEKFSTLSGEHQRIALYLLTAQSNRIGLFAFSVGKACEELQLSRPVFMKGLLHVSHTLNWQWDAIARVLYIPSWWKYNQPESWKTLKGNLKDMDDLPATTLLGQFAANTTYLAENVKPTFIEILDQALAKASISPPDTHAKPLASQKQDQKQEQKQEQKQDNVDTLQPPPQCCLLRRFGLVGMHDQESKFAKWLKAPF